MSRFCVVEYDGRPYPGVIEDVDEDDLEVKTMHLIGKNRYFWPMIDDILWYKKDKVVTLLHSPPEQVTSRHKKINEQVWKLIEPMFDWD